MLDEEANVDAFLLANRSSAQRTQLLVHYLELFLCLTLMFASVYALLYRDLSLYIIL